MGFMTEVSILNDRFSEIERNPDRFVTDILAGMNHGGDRNFLAQTTVIPSHQADDIRVYFSGRNSFFDAYPRAGMSKERLERHLKYLKEMKAYIKIAEGATKSALMMGEVKA